MATPWGKTAEKSELPLVSIITPSFNQVDFIEETILSVINQDYPNIEYIVIDGGSTDGSQEIIEKYAERLAFWTSEPDKGQADAINKGFQRATGEIVAWLNSDDMYMAGAIRQAVEALKANPQVGLVYGNGLMIDASGQLLDPHSYQAYDVLDLICFDVILQPTVFMRRSALEEADFLGEEYHLVLDHELWIRIASKYPILHVPSYWAVERTHVDAKTVAQAAGWVDEAQRFLSHARDSKELGPIIAGNERRVQASFHAFSARRLIDAGQYGTAVKNFIRAFAFYPPVVFRYWYKVVQAVCSALGLEGLFFIYRGTRRRLRFGNDLVVIGDHGAALVEKST
jgi:glycosyltransferase involved in cell wall biosynthesis